MNTDTPTTPDPEDPSSMTAIRKFLFDRSFDEEEILEEEVQEEPEEIEPEEEVPSYSEEEMAAAREEAFAKGKEEGVNEAAEATERDILAALNALQGRFDALFKSQEEADTSILESAISVAVTITRKAFPTLNGQNGLKEVERMVRLTLEKILEEPVVNVTVHPDFTAALKERLDTIAAKANYKGKVEVLGADDIPPGDCRVEWAGGGAQRNLDALWQEIDEIIERNLSGELAPAETAGEASEEAPKVSPEPEAPSSEAEAPKDTEPEPEEASGDTDQDEPAEPASEAPVEAPSEAAPAAAEDTEPEPPEEAPEPSGDEDTDTDPEHT